MATFFAQLDGQNWQFVLAERSDASARVILWCRKLCTCHAEAEVPFCKLLLLGRPCKPLQPRTNKGIGLNSPQRISQQLRQQGTLR